MHYFEYHQKSPFNQQKAKKKYPWLSEKSLSDEGIEARFFLLQYLQKIYGFKGTLEKDTKGKPIPLMVQSLGMKLYWSLSHSRNFTAYALSDTPVGIDIAEYRERCISLLSVHGDREYKLLGEKNWNNFYILWTAKEALIKAWGNTLDDIEDIQLIKIYEGERYIFGFQKKTYTIEHEQHGSLFLSVTH